jgi:2-iminobutanoate/2-iminopropanoate deaminase
MRQIIKTKEAPEAIGPYSQAVVAGGFVFTSGQIPLVPETKELVAGGIAEQTEQVLRNLSKVLEAAGSSLEQVVKTTVYLSDMRDFAAMNEVYARFFTAEPPARSTVQVAGLPLNAGVRVEMDVVALVKK